MSQIRKNSIKGTIWIYLGFVVGAVNMLLFSHKEWFTPDQLGLSNTLRDISLLLAAFSVFGSPSFLIKFFPYYADNLPKKENDILGKALLVTIAGFSFTALVVWLCEPLIIRKFATNSPMLVSYFYLTLLMAFFIAIFNILEFYAYGFGKGILNNILKEFGLRLIILLLIALKIFNIISFHVFIWLFCLQYAVIAGILGLKLYKEGHLWVNFKTSRVTHKFRKKIIAMMIFTALVVIVAALRNSIDSMVLASKKDLNMAGIYGFSIYLISILQAPYRSMVSIVIPILSRAWKAKNLAEIERIYRRSSINLLSFALWAFACIWMNFEQGIAFFGINPDFLAGKWVVLIMGIVTIIEMGTGVNSQIIGTSTFWRFEMGTNLLLTLMIIPLSYYLTIRYGITGPAFASLISFSVYNLIRFIFLQRKFGLQPFTRATIEVIVIFFILLVPIDYLFKNTMGLVHIVGTLGLFTFLFGYLIYIRKVSPDATYIFKKMANKVIPFQNK